MNFGIYPGVGPGGGSQSEGWPIIGQAIEMGYSVNSFTANGQEYLKSGVAKPYTPKYLTFFNRNPYACSHLTAYTEHKSVSNLGYSANFTYISLANGYHYIIPVEASSSAYDGCAFVYSNTLSSGFSFATTYGGTSLARANVAVPHNNYVALGIQSSTDTVGMSVIVNATISATITGFSLYSLASNGSTSLLGLTQNNTNLVNGSTTQFKKFTSTAGGYPSSATAVTSAVGVSHSINIDSLACISSTSTYLCIGYTSSGFGYNVLSILKSTDVGTNWSLLHTGSIPLSSTLSSFRASRNFASNGTSAIINMYGEANYASTLIWTDGTTVQNIDLSAILPSTYALNNAATVNYDSVKDLYYIHFFQYGTTKTGVFTIYSKDGKSWYPKFNVYPSQATAMVEVKTSRGTTLALTYPSINTNSVSSYIDISAYISKSIPAYINTTNPASGNSLNTFYRVA